MATVTETLLISKDFFSFEPSLSLRNTKITGHKEAIKTLKITLAEYKRSVFEIPR